MIIIDDNNVLSHTIIAATLRSIYRSQSI